MYIAFLLFKTTAIDPSFSTYNNHYNNNTIFNITLSLKFYEEKSNHLKEVC